jgi:hypothetical protein
MNCSAVPSLRASIHWTRELREKETVNYSVGLVDIMSRFCNDFAPSARVKNVASVTENGKQGRVQHVNTKKGNVLPTHVTKAYRGIRGITPLILNLGANWRWVVKFTPRLAGDHNGSQRFGEQKSLFPLQGFEPSDIRSSSLVSILTALSSLFTKPK